MTALVFVSFVIIIDFLVVALLINRSLEMFNSLLGTWIPFALSPATLNPLIVEVMKESGYDISNNKVKSAFDFYKEGRRYNYVIAVCIGLKSGPKSSSGKWRIKSRRIL
jgi:hypothetical protein